MKFKVLLLIMLMATAVSAAQPVIVTGSYTRDFTANLAGVNPRPCSDKTMYESGQCAYLYHCMTVQPRYSNDLRDALYKYCEDVTNKTSSTLNLVFVPPRGQQLIAVGFLAVQNCTANCYPNCASQPFLQWSCQYNISKANWQASSLVSLCPDGKMLKENYCFSAQAVCIDPQDTNMCDNPYQLYVLDRDGNGLFTDNYNRPQDFCADRNGDLVCDTVESLYCSDVDMNGVCDADDIRVINASCIDLNKNFVCDQVESEGAFCQFLFQPVCVGNLTYPNECFAKAAGYTAWTTGACVPPIVQCYQDADCQPVCDGVSKACVNYQCRYMGECNPQKIQCAAASDCPAPYCVGVATGCVTNRCAYTGTCINKPDPSISIWDKLINTFTIWIQMVKSYLGW